MTDKGQWDIKRHKEKQIQMEKKVEERNKIDIKSDRN
jgi:hypothetical protein